MISVHFSKSFAETVIDALATGKPIAPPSGEWTGNEMLMLAGMLTGAVFSQGPHAHQAAGITAEMRATMHSEQREAVEDTFGRDIHDATEFVSMLFFKVADDEYDHQFGPEVRAVISRDGEKTQVRPAKGFKGHNDIVE